MIKQYFRMTPEPHIQVVEYVASSTLESPVRSYNRVNNEIHNR